MDDSTPLPSVSIDDILSDSPSPATPVPEPLDPTNPDPHAIIGDKNLHVKAKGRNPFKFQSPVDMQKEVDKFFADPDSLPWTMSGLALALDTTRMTLLDYKPRNGFGAIIVKAKQRIENSIEKKLLQGGNATGVIFNLCNNYKEGWHQKQETDLNIGGQKNNPLSISVNFVKAPSSIDGSDA